MSATVTGPVTLAPGTQSRVDPPAASSYDRVKVTNLSPYGLQIGVAAGDVYVAPWVEDLLEVPATSAALTISPTTPPGASVPSGASAALYATWYTKDEQLAGTWPVSLVANAIAADIAGGTITLSGQIPVVNGTPTPLQVGGTVQAGAVLGSSSPFTGQRSIAVTGTAVQLPNSATGNGGVWLRPDPANAKPIYVGASGVTSANGIALAPGDPPTLFLFSNSNLLWINGTAGDTVTILTT